MIQKKISRLTFGIINFVTRIEIFTLYKNYDV